MSPGKASDAGRGRVSTAAAVFDFLTRLATRQQRVSYGDFAHHLGLGSPRGLGWLLTPLLRWCEARGLPPLPIIVVRRADGLPSGSYEPDTIKPETERVFTFEWTAVSPPSAAELAGPRHV